MKTQEIKPWFENKVNKYRPKKLKGLKIENNTTKLEKLKEAMKNPPPERLAKIEFRSHFMQILGIAIVSLILIIKGFWYIIFALIFGVGVSYSQGMTAYRKYVQISSILGKEDPVKYEMDISPTRRKGNIITHALGKGPKWGSIAAAVIGSVLIIPPTMSRWLLTPAYLLSMAIIFSIVYYFFFYWIAYPMYKREMKLG